MSQNRIISKFNHKTVYKLNQNYVQVLIDYDNGDDNDDIDEQFRGSEGFSEAQQGQVIQK